MLRDAIPAPIDVSCPTRPPVNAVDLADPSTFLTGPPYEYFAYLRQHEPVSWHDHDSADGSGFWAVTRYDDVLAVERDPETFSSYPGTLIEPTEGGELLLINQDPPRHTRLRHFVSRMFTPRHLLSIEESIQAAVHELVDRATRKREFDFVEEISVPLPAIAIAELLGVPPSDRSKIFEWSNRMVGVDDPEFGQGEGSDREAAAELFEYAQALAQDRIADPRDDIVTLLLTSELDGETLDPIEFNLFFLLLAVAGNAPRSLITGGVLALLEHPAEHARLRSDPSLLPSAIEEMLRFVSPVNYFRRTVARDTELRGVPLRAGDKVTLWYSSANRDERQFPDPTRFDVTRHPNAHVAFGGRGPHHCLGSHLARLQIRLMFEALLDGMLDRLELTGPVVRLRQNVVNGIKHMPVRLRQMSAA